MFEDVLAFHERATLWVDAGVPVPVSISVVVEGWPLLVKLRVAEAAPGT
jgi:hypothetical protein